MSPGAPFLGGSAADLTNNDSKCFTDLCPLLLSDSMLDCIAWPQWLPTTPVANAASTQPEANNTVAYGAGPLGCPRLVTPTGDLVSFPSPESSLKAKASKPATVTTVKKEKGKRALKETVLNQDGKPASSTQNIKYCGSGSSTFRGVTRHRHTGKWEAHLWDSSFIRPDTTKTKGGRSRGKQVYLGGYVTELEAAQAYDRAAIAFWGESAKLNFGLEPYVEELDNLLNLPREEVIAALRRGSSGFARGVSRYRGVTLHQSSAANQAQPAFQEAGKRWEARMGRIDGDKYLYLGAFATELEAAIAFDLAVLKHRGTRGVTNLPRPLYYDASQKILSLEEAVAAAYAQGLAEDGMSHHTHPAETAHQPTWTGDLTHTASLPAPSPSVNITTAIATAPAPATGQLTLAGPDPCSGACSDSHSGHQGASQHRCSDGGGSEVGVKVDSSCQESKQVLSTQAGGVKAESASLACAHGMGGAMLFDSLSYAPVRTGSGLRPPAKAPAAANSGLRYMYSTGAMRQVSCPKDNMGGDLKHACSTSMVGTGMVDTGMLGTGLVGSGMGVGMGGGGMGKNVITCTDTGLGKGLGNGLGNGSGKNDGPARRSELKHSHSTGMMDWGNGNSSGIKHTHSTGLLGCGMGMGTGMGEGSRIELAHGMLGSCMGGGLKHARSTDHIGSGDPSIKHAYTTVGSSGDGGRSGVKDEILMGEYSMGLLCDGNTGSMLRHRYSLGTLDARMLQGGGGGNNAHSNISGGSGSTCSSQDGNGVTTDADGGRVDNNGLGHAAGHGPNDDTTNSDTTTGGTTTTAAAPNGTTTYVLTTAAATANPFSAWQRASAVGNDPFALNTHAAGHTPMEVGESMAARPMEHGEPMFKRPCWNGGASDPFACMDDPPELEALLAAMGNPVPSTKAMNWY